MRLFPFSLGPIVLAVFALLLATGCRAKIGDKCALSTDCSAQGDRLCDTTQPGGYCTIFNCEPFRCPGESVCVEFHAQIDPTCPDPRRFPRFERTFCMRRCTSDGDCRDGYACVNQERLLSTYDALLVDEDSSICIPNATPAPTEVGSTAVCQLEGGSPMPSPDDIPYWDGGTDGGAGGAAGSGGEAGAGGDAGASGAGGADSGGMSGGGGSAGSGGTPAGGMSGFGGMSGGGGMSGSAGMSGSGGMSGTGGMSGSGGMSGFGGAGGVSGAGGAKAGASGAGGAAGVAGASGGGGSGGA